MTIRDIKLFTAALWDWGIFNGCFGNTRCRVGDVDGILERCGEVLFIEGKPTGYAPPVGEQWKHGQSPTNGQARLWSALAHLGITVMIFYGEATDPDQPMMKTPMFMQQWRRGQAQPDPCKSCSIDIARREVTRWWQWAERMHAEFT